MTSTTLTLVSSLALFGLFQPALVEAHLIAGYKASAQVTDHAAIDLDQQLLQSLLDQQDLTGASLLYSKGAHSKSYASVTLEESTGRINKNMAFVGTTISGKPIVLYAYSDYDVGETSIRLRYATSDVQEEYSFCQVGANTNPVVHGCLAQNGTVQLDGIKSKPLSYTYDPMTDNKNGRTLAGFSTGAEKKMAKCEACPYVDYDKYLTYYGQFDYGNHYVSAAFEQRQTNFTNGNVDFSTYSVPALSRTIEIATQNMNVWMYVIREFEDALDDCNGGCASDECNSDKVNAWDEGIAFYAGSLEGEDGSGQGVLTYALADELCVDFKTCGETGDTTTGTSHVNHEIFRLSTPAVALLMAEQCLETREYVERIVGYMTVPLVQGLLRAFYQTTGRGGGEQTAEAMDIAKGEAAAYAATVVPILHECSAEDAAFVQQQLEYKNLNENRDFVAVKETLERHYECMSVTCEQVGGLWNPNINAYRKGAAACSSPKEASDLGLILGLSLAGAAVVALMIGKVVWDNRKQKMVGDKSDKLAANFLDGAC